LQLKAVTSDLGVGSRSVIDGVRRLLLDEQQRIRGFVEERQKSIGQQKVALHPKMRELVDNNERRWGCHIPLSVAPEDTEIRPELARQLDFILAEAIANAVRHGQASCIDVKVKASPNRLLLSIGDNGHGFVGVTGVYDLSELAARKMGPVSLRNRIAESSGSLTLSSSPQGVELQVELPI
jgi:signal transduction histidine kinase